LGLVPFPFFAAAADTDTDTEAADTETDTDTETKVSATSLGYNARLRKPSYSNLLFLNASRISVASL
jgi:hypothetical protein